MEDRSMGVWFGKIAWICGHILPLKLLVSTVLSTTGNVEHLCGFQKRDVVVDDRLAVKIGDPKEHLRLKIDNCDDTVVRRQKSLFAAFRTSISLSHDFLLLEVSSQRYCLSTVSSNSLWPSIGGSPRRSPRRAFRARNARCQAARQRHWDCHGDTPPLRAE
jgi:hypothetical protein